MPTYHLLNVMHASLSKTFQALTRHTLGLTLYNLMQSSHDFVDVQEVLHDRTSWSIELFRTCFTIRLSNGSWFFMLSTMVFLVIAENIHVYYGRLSPAKLKERVQQMGYLTFALLFAVLDIGFVVVRVTGLVTLSGSPGLAASLVLVSIFPSVTLPVLTHLVKLLARRNRESHPRDIETGLGPVVDDPGSGDT